MKSPTTTQSIIKTTILSIPIFILFPQITPDSITYTLLLTWMIDLSNPLPILLATFFRWHFIFLIPFIFLLSNKRYIPSIMLSLATLSILIPLSSNPQTPSHSQLSSLYMASPSQYPDANPQIFHQNRHTTFTCNSVQYLDHISTSLTNYASTHPIHTNIKSCLLLAIIKLKIHLFPYGILLIPFFLLSTTPALRLWILIHLSNILFISAFADVENRFVLITAIPLAYYIIEDLLKRYLFDRKWLLNRFLSVT